MPNNAYSRFDTSQVAAFLIAVCLQNVAVPLSGDANAVKKYANEMEKIKKQVGVCSLLLGSTTSNATPHLTLPDFSRLEHWTP